MMKRILLWGVVALTLLAFVGCKDDPEDDPPTFTLDKVEITNIPGQAAALDMVTFMMVTVTNNNREAVATYAVAGGKIGELDVPPIDTTTNTAELDLYDSASVTTFLMGLLQGSLGPEPTKKNITGSSFTVSVLYAKYSDGEDIQMPSNSRTLQVPADLKNGTLVLDWTNGN
jgi:hypothetical protein